MKRTKHARKPLPKAKPPKPAKPTTPATGLDTFYSFEQKATLDYQLQLARKPRGLWHKFVVQFKEQHDLIISMPLARAIHTMPAQEILGLFFARYTAPAPHLEIQICRSVLSEQADVSKLNKNLSDYILRICRKAHLKGVQVVSINPCNGSFMHMRAFQMACIMEDQDSNSLKGVGDVVHWLANMLGFSYAQEAESFLRHAHVMLTNAVGYYEKPMFQNPFVTYRQTQQALAEMEASKRAVGIPHRKSNGVTKK